MIRFSSVWSDVERFVLSCVFLLKRFLQVGDAFNALVKWSYPPFCLCDIQTVVWLSYILLILRMSLFTEIGKEETV